MQQFSGPIVLGIFALVFIWFAVAFLRRSRQRRREMFADEGSPVVPASEPPAEPDRGSPPSPPEGEDVSEDSGLAPEAGTTSQLDDTDEVPTREAPDDDEWAQLDATDEVPTRVPSDADREDFLSDTGKVPVREFREIDPSLKEGLARTGEGFFGRLGNLFSRDSLDPAILEELEEALLVADVGVRLTTDLIEELRGEIRGGRVRDGEALRAHLKARMLDAVSRAPTRSDPLGEAGTPPRVILFVGVNGVGKTTTIGKVASLLKERGKSVALAAGDTFRAAAAEQLAIWGERTDCRVIRGEEGTDPASVIFNAVQHGVQAEIDVVLADTAGRLHTKTELMDEIQKVRRAAGKARDGAPDEVWLVVDATTGQNALRQAEEFHQALGLTGVILTKLDGTAKGGVVVAIAQALSLPVLFVGVGEQARDLRPFDPRGFIEALFAW